MTRLSVSKGCLQTDVRILSLIIKYPGSFLTTKWTREFKKDKESSFFNQAQMGKNVFDCTGFFFSSILLSIEAHVVLHRHTNKYTNTKPLMHATHE